MGVWVAPRTEVCNESTISFKICWIPKLNYAAKRAQEAMVLHSLGVQGWECGAVPLVSCALTSWGSFGNLLNLYRLEYQDHMGLTSL